MIPRGALLVAVPAWIVGGDRQVMLEVRMLEVEIRSVAPLDGGILALFDDFPLDMFLDDEETGGYGAVAADAAAGDSEIGPRDASPGTEGVTLPMRVLKDAGEVNLWVAVSENENTDRLACVEPTISGSRLPDGGVALRIQCGGVATEEILRWLASVSGASGGGATVPFERNASDLSGEAVRILRELTIRHADRGGSEILIGGYAAADETDPPGLAWRRADAVRRFLADLGLAAGRMNAISHGTEGPAEVGGNEEPWSHNRIARVMVARGIDP